MAKPLTTTTETDCPCCGDHLDKKGICWNCYDQLNAELADDDPKWHEHRRAYRGGRWIVDGFMRGRRSEGEAIALAEKPGNIHFALELEGFYGLVDILADRYATEALRQLILAGDTDTLKVLSDCHKGGRFYQAKRGPKPKTGVHLEREVLRLKRAGKTNGEIAKLLGMKKSTVAAAYNNVRNKIAKEQIADRRQ